MEFNDEELLRYSRQILLSEIDLPGQSALKQAKVAIVGLGGLGSPVAMYLASAGVGQLTFVDFDEVELSNLQRQIAHSSQSIGLAKVDSAAQTCLSLNPDINITTRCEKLESEDLVQLANSHDIVVDCTDNFTTRHEINLACQQTKTTLVSGAAIGFQGQVSVFTGLADAPCYACLYPDTGDDANLNCAESGVIAPLVGLIGSIQALEVCKLITAAGKTLAGRLLLVDGLTMDIRTIQLAKDPSCSVCS